MEKNGNRSIRFASALTSHGWMDDAVLSIDADGTIRSIENGADVEADVVTDWVALPGMVNVHSHAFQRGFAGMSEFRTCQRDSFWTWRDLMFRFLERLEPDAARVIARQLYLEMLASGNTWVGEFHYVHTGVNGRPYQNLAEMSDAMLLAARDTGIGICLMPVLYQRGGFRDEPLKSGQKRFFLGDEDFFRLVTQLWDRPQETNLQIAVALHSLRAVDAATGNRVLESLRRIRPESPVHIHVAEQIPEVEECLAKHNRRPVEYLFDQYPVDAGWCLIHATHLHDNEIRMIGESGAVAGLCPATEGNLGDGYFPARPFLDSGGRIALGSDSHCSVDWCEDLRMLEYHQRLQSHGRAVLGTDGKSVGRNLFEKCAAGGAAAIGLNAGEIAVGKRADLMLVDRNHPRIAGAERDRLLDRMIFCNTISVAAGCGPVAGVMVGGVTTDFRSDSWREACETAAREFVGLVRKFQE